MPGGVVEQDSAVLLPARRLEVQLALQIAQKQRHHVGVGVGLRQGAPHLALRVESNDQRDPRLHLLVANGASSISWNPKPADEPRLVQPALVNVDYAMAVAFLQHRQHLQRVLLSQHQAAFTVGLHRDRACLPVAHMQLLPHRLAHLFQAHFKARLVFYGRLHLLSAINCHVVRKPLADRVLDGLLLLNLFVFSLTEILELLRLLLILSHQAADKKSGDSELLGHVYLLTEWLLGGSDDLHNLLGAQVLAVALLVLSGRAFLLEPLLLKVPLRPPLDVVRRPRLLLSWPSIGSS